MEGWKFTNEEKIEHPEKGASVAYNWVERNVDASLNDLKKFAEDLKDASSKRLDGGVSKISCLLSECFDFEQMLIALEGNLKPEARSPLHCLKDRNRYLKMGKTEFAIWFRYVSLLSHIQDSAEKYCRLDEGSAEAVYHSFKEVMCELFWGNLREYGIACLSVANKPLKQHFISLAPDPVVTGIRQQFKLKLLDRSEVTAFLDECCHCLWKYCSQ